MSFGFSAGDFVLAAQLAWKVLQNTRRACEAQDNLIQEVSNLHVVLRRVEIEVAKPESLTNRICDDYKEEMGSIVQTCERWLKLLDGILEKYNALGEKKRSAAKVWQRVKFGNGEMQDLDHIRLELGNSYAAMNVYLSLMSSSSQGRVEQMMKSHGGTLAEMLPLLNNIAGSLTARTKEGTILTSYSNDDSSVWKELRRELRAEGLTSSSISKHKHTIKAYIMELGDRGALDEVDIEALKLEPVAANVAVSSPDSKHLSAIQEDEDDSKDNGEDHHGSSSTSIEDEILKENDSSPESSQDEDHSSSSTGFGWGWNAENSDKEQLKITAEERQPDEPILDRKFVNSLESTPFSFKSTSKGKVKIDITSTPDPYSLMSTKEGNVKIGLASTLGLDNSLEWGTFVARRSKRGKKVDIASPQIRTGESVPDLQADDLERCSFKPKQDHMEGVVGATAVAKTVTESKIYSGFKALEIPRDLVNDSDHHVHSNGTRQRKPRHRRHSSRQHRHSVPRTAMTQATLSGFLLSKAPRAPLRFLGLLPPVRSSREDDRAFNPPTPAQDEPTSRSYIRRTSMECKEKCPKEFVIFKADCLHGHTYRFCFGCLNYLFEQEIQELVRDKPPFPCPRSIIFQPSSGEHCCARMTIPFESFKLLLSEENHKALERLEYEE